MLEDATRQPRLAFSVPPNLMTAVLPAALRWLLCVEKQRHPLFMTKEEEWQKIKMEEAFPIPRESCLFHGTYGHLKTIPPHATGKAGDVRSLASTGIRHGRRFVSRVELASVQCLPHWLNDVHL